MHSYGIRCIRALLLIVAMPLALELVVPFFTVLVWRIDENSLRMNLPGYALYMQKVRYRLVPGVWLGRW
jgi:hypothetical protein